MDSKTEKQLNKVFKEKFKEVHLNGLLQGTKAISKVILDKANDTSKTSEERLEDIIKFCEVSLKEKD